MNGQESAGVAKGLDLSAITIKEGKRLSANVYPALALVISSYCYREVHTEFQFGSVSAFSSDFNYDTT